jgi:glycosyltransferase involved in cell wall biosynthesis
MTGPDPVSRPLRILHCIASFTGGGAEHQLATLCEAAESHAQDFHFHVAHLYGGPHLDRVMRSGAPVHELPVTGHYDPRTPFAIAGIIRQQQIDVVQTWLPNMDIFGGLAARFTRRPLVLSERSSAECYPAGWKTVLRRSVGSRANAIVANSLAGLDYWKPLVPQPRIHLIPNAIDSARLASAPPLTREQQGFASGAGRIIIYAGRLTAAKNLDVLCDALGLLITRHPDVTALLFGDGELRAHLEQRVNALQSDRIHLMGFTDRLPAWLRVASLFVSLSKFEGQPNVVLECAYLRVPQVLSDIPQHRETVGESGAFFASPDSPQSACDAMLACLNQVDLRAQKITAASSKVADLTAERVLAQYHDLYRSLIL